MNSVVYFDMPVKEMDRAQKFYSEVFGWQINQMPGMEDYWGATTSKVDEKFMPAEVGKINGGMYVDKEGKDYPAIVLEVADMDEHIAKVEAAGGKTAMPKQQIGDMGFYAKVEDTEGNVIGLWQNIKA